MSLGAVLGAGPGANDTLARSPAFAPLVAALERELALVAAGDLARGDGFLACVRGNASPAGLRACDRDQRCRDDYVCARSERGGVCLPPYFVFQLRVDGHSSSLR